tara:strand:- start:347 stop:502 length:156 start_codon:yes stop_codon:yes gene_type:complete
MVISVIAEAARVKPYAPHRDAPTNIDNRVVSDLYIKSGKREEVALFGIMVD